MERKIVRYRVSSDRKGLLGYFEDGTYYHIHFNELTQLEKWLLELFNKISECTFGEELWNYMKKLQICNCKCNHGHIAGTSSNGRDLIICNVCGKEVNLKNKKIEKLKESNFFENDYERCLRNKQNEIIDAINEINKKL